MISPSRFHWSIITTRWCALPAALARWPPAWCRACCAAQCSVARAFPTPSTAGQGARGIALFTVEAQRDGFVREPAYELPAAHTLAVGGFRLENYFAPDEALLEPAGAGFQASLAAINGARTYVAAMCAGMLDSALWHAVRYASRRQAFGTSLIEFQGLRWSLVDAHTDLAALRLLAYRAADEINNHRHAEE